MQGDDFAKVIVEAKRGVQLCSSFKYEALQPECKKMTSEFEGMIIKAKARQQNTNALELKEQEAKPKEEEEPQQKAVGISAVGALSTFALTSGIVYLGLVGLNKLNK